MSIGLYGGYIVKSGSLIVLQEYEIDRSLCGVEEKLRNCLELLTVRQVTDCAY